MSQAFLRQSALKLGEVLVGQNDKQFRAREVKGHLLGCVLGERTLLPGERVLVLKKYVEPALSTCPVARS